MATTYPLTQRQRSRDVGFRLTRARMRKFATYKEAAEAAGINPRTWRRAELGVTESGETHVASRETIIAMARVLELDPAPLLASLGHGPVAYSKEEPALDRRVVELEKQLRGLSRRVTALEEAVVGGRGVTSLERPRSLRVRGGRPTTQ